METPVLEQERLLTWEDLCNAPHFQVLDNLPYKIELNEWGQIVMSPTYLKHGKRQYTIARLIEKLRNDDSEVIVECAICTRKGTKVADVACFSGAQWEQVQDAFESPIAPEICVEVRSPRNSNKEMEEKSRLYFEAGATEVWICNKNGQMKFFNTQGHLQHSMLVPAFPQSINA